MPRVLRSVLWALILLGGLLCGTPARAEELHGRILGLNPASGQILFDDGVVLTVNEHTTIRGELGEPARFADLASGDVLAAHYDLNGDQRVATDIEVVGEDDPGTGDDTGSQRT